MADKTFEGFAKLEKDEFLLLLTAARVDSVGDVIIPEGVSLHVIKKTGSVVWIHSEGAPVASLTDTFLVPGELWGKARFHQKPANWGDAPYLPLFVENYARESLRLGKSPGVSVRITPLDNGVRNANAHDVARFGPSCRQVVSRSVLKEVSLTPLPCLSDAAVVDIGKSAGFSANQASSLFNLASRRVVLTLPAPKQRVRIFVPMFKRD